MPPSASWPAPSTPPIDVVVDACGPTNHFGAEQRELGISLASPRHGDPDFDDRYRYENVTLQLGIEVVVALCVGWLVLRLRGEAAIADARAITVPTPNDGDAAAQLRFMRRQLQVVRICQPGFWVSASSSTKTASSRRARPALASQEPSASPRRWSGR